MATRITPAEMRVLQVLIEAGEATTKTVYGSLGESSGWAQATVDFNTRHLNSIDEVHFLPPQRAHFFRKNELCLGLFDLIEQGF